MRGQRPVIGTLFLAVMALLALAACASPLPLPHPFAAAPTATPTVTPTPTPVATEEPPHTPTPAVLDLVWWTPSWFSPESGDPAGAFLARRVQEFEHAHANVRVHVLTKLPTGKGGIADYLQGAYRVAPSLLPDLVAINLYELPTLNALGLFQPLDDALPADLVQDMYPVALAAGKVEGVQRAVQFEADFYHLAYLPKQVPTPPATWEALLNSDVTYLSWLFAGENDVSDVVVLQYVASGGELPTTKAVPLNEQALFSVFNFYDQALRRGVISEQAKSPLSANDLWSALLAGQAAMADVPARRYLREGVARADVAAAPIPTWDGQPRALTRGWGLAITASDPARREAARALMLWLLAPETLGAWAQMAGYVPTRRAALAAWNVAQPYRATLDAMLQHAVPYPAHPAMASLRSALAAGLQAMLSEGVSPEEAVRRAQKAYAP